MILIILLGLIFLNAVFAMAEIAIVSSRKSKLREMATENRGGARQALAMARNPVNFFSTIQVGVTLVGVVMGAIGERTFIPPLAQFIEQFPLIGAYSQQTSFLITIGAITYITLIIGELVPKRIAVSNPEKIASFLAPPIQLFLTASFPLVWFFGKSTEIVLRLLRIKTPRKTDESTDGETALANQNDLGSGVDMVYFNNLPVNTFMTQRKNIQWFDIDSYSHKDIREHYGTYPFSQVIFCSESLDHVVGVIHIKELLRYYLTDPHFNIRKAVKPPPEFGEDALALQVLDRLGSTPAQIAIIKDQDGNTTGMVTPDDIMRACVENGRYGPVTP